MFGHVITQRWSKLEALHNKMAQTQSHYFVWTIFVLNEKYVLAWLTGVSAYPSQSAEFFLLESQWKLTWNCIPSLIHHTAGIFSQLTWRLHPRRVKEEWKPSAPVGCWSIHVKYRSDGRIIIGSSWWRVFRQRGVPFSPHLHIPTPFFLILCLLQSASLINSYSDNWLNFKTLYVYVQKCWQLHLNNNKVHWFRPVDTNCFKAKIIFHVQAEKLEPEN